MLDLLIANKFGTYKLSCFQKSNRTLLKCGFLINVYLRSNTYFNRNCKICMQMSAFMKTRIQFIWNCIGNLFMDVIQIEIEGPLSMVSPVNKINSWSLSWRWVNRRRRRPLMELADVVCAKGQLELSVLSSHLLCGFLRLTVSNAPSTSMR
jgi:hypothetical protein